MAKRYITMRRITNLVVLAGLLIGVRVSAQPIADSVRAMQKTNDKNYRILESLDDNGNSYSFTNVIKWKITDAGLQTQLRDILAKEPFNLKREEFDVSEYYLFCAPVPGTDRVQPFHILVRGSYKEKTGKKKKGGIGLFSDDDAGGGQIVPKAFMGHNVIRLFVRNQALLDDVNSIQGENVEIPGEIVPHGSQLVKDTRMRYIYSKMFSQFYSKRAVLDEQRAFYGLPTSDQDFAPTPGSGDDSAQVPIDPERTQELPDAMLASARETRYDKIVDLSVNHLWVNVTKNIGLELETGHSEVGLPVWSTGDVRVWLNLKNQIGSESSVKLGVDVPVNYGNSSQFTFPARKLSGSLGGSLDAYFAGIDFFSAFDMPIALKLSVMPSGQGSNGSIIMNGQAIAATAIDGTQVTIPANRTFYRTALIAQLYIPTIVQLDLNNFVQVSAGIGILDVEQSILPNDGNSKDVDYTRARPGDHPIWTSNLATSVVDMQRVSPPVSPHFVVEYVNHKNSKFGLSAGYDHEFMFGGWIELIQDHLRLELGYSSPLIRDAKPWEPSSFFTITPRIYF